MDIRLWTFDIRIWTLDIRIWTLDIRIWTLDIRIWTLDIEGGGSTLPGGHFGRLAFEKEYKLLGFQPDDHMLGK